MLLNFIIFQVKCNRHTAADLDFAYKRLLNKPNENKVTLAGQNTPLKHCQPLELLIHLKKDVDLLLLKI